MRLRQLFILVFLLIPSCTGIQAQIEVTPTLSNTSIPESTATLLPGQTAEPTRLSMATDGPNVLPSSTPKPKLEPVNLEIDRIIWGKVYCPYNGVVVIGHKLSRLEGLTLTLEPVENKVPLTFNQTIYGRCDPSDFSGTFVPPIRYLPMYEVQEIYYTYIVLNPLAPVLSTKVE